MYVENDPRKSESEMNDVVLTIKVLTFTEYNMSKWPQYYNMHIVSLTLA